MKNRNTVLDFVKKIREYGKDRLRSFLFPSFCLHCKEPVGQDQLLCSDCGSLIDFVDPIDARTTAVLTPLGPALSLIPGFEAPNEEKIADLIAALIVVQIDRIGWPVPGVVVPVPSRSFNSLLARSLSSLFAVPVVDALKKKSLLFRKGFVWDGAKIPERATIFVVDLFLLERDLISGTEGHAPFFLVGFVSERP